jgi:UDP-N-acetylmuramate--alanine ligase
MKHRIRKIHFVGIGGIGMSGIAEVLLNLGFEVSGSDLRESSTVLRLRELGGKVMIGHAHENVGDTDVVVISSAVKSDNPEVVAARYQGIPVIPRAEMLAELMRMKRGIAVAGSHGKTTITSMIASVMANAGLDPTAIIGGKLELFDSNAKLGQSEWMVAEADESDGSFLYLNPTVAVVSNIDREHMEHYKTIENLHQTFVEFMNRVPFYGLVAAGADDPIVRALIPRIKRRVITYGTADDCDIRAVDVKCGAMGCEFVVVSEGRRLGEVKLGLPGAHNAVNALAALAVAFELEVDFETAAEALHGFSGLGRRFEIKGRPAGVTVVDDYGHHPTEIKATLQAAREYMEGMGSNKDSRLVVAFQPHRYTRTQDLWDEFVGSFSEPDLLFLSEIYSAGEGPINGVTSQALFEDVLKKRSETGHETFFIESMSEIATTIAQTVKEGDLVLTLGAGSVHKIGSKLIDILGREQ